jgi:hypothetical protein
MNPAALRLDEDRRHYEPGAKLSGVVSWHLDHAPRNAEVRLYWQTGGKGNREVTVVDRRTLAAPAARDQRVFDFHLPRLPYSFAGQVLSLTWGVELVLEPGALTCDQAIVMAPEGKAIALSPAP